MALNVSHTSPLYTPILLITVIAISVVGRLSISPSYIFFFWYNQTHEDCATSHCTNHYRQPPSVLSSISNKQARRVQYIYKMSPQHWGWQFGCSSLHLSPYVSRFCVSFCLCHVYQSDWLIDWLNEISTIFHSNLCHLCSSTCFAIIQPIRASFGDNNRSIVHLAWNRIRSMMRIMFQWFVLCSSLSSSSP